LLYKDGSNDPEIWYNTGWFRDDNGKWKNEISDDGYKVKTYKPGSYQLGDLVDHPDLFKILPALKTVPVQLIDGKNEDPDLTGAYRPFDGEQGSIRVVMKPGKSEEDIASTLLHEIQHAVQATGKTFSQNLDEFMEENKAFYTDRPSEREAYDAANRWAIRDVFPGYREAILPRAARDRDDKYRQALKDEAALTNDRTKLDAYLKKEQELLLKLYKPKKEK
jgi:hypothetical protein